MLVLVNKDTSCFLPCVRCDPIDPRPGEAQHPGRAGRGDGEMRGGPGARRGRVPHHYQVLADRPSLFSSYSDRWVTPLITQQTGSRSEPAGSSARSDRSGQRSLRAGGLDGSRLWWERDLTTIQSICCSKSRSHLDCYYEVLCSLTSFRTCFLFVWWWSHVVCGAASWLVGIFLISWFSPEKQTAGVKAV